MYHRDEFRTARANASKDAEAYDEILYAVERFGVALHPQGNSLNDFREKVLKSCEQSSLASTIPETHNDWHTPASRLYEIVRHARNDAFHQGAFARHLTSHAIELAIILEDALTQLADAKIIRDFMVRGPICASLWQPLSFVRQQMLVGSFSYLPLWKDEGWHLISDFEVARYLSSAPSDTQRKKRLAYTVEAAIADGMPTPSADILRADDPAEKFFQFSASSPALVCRKDKETGEEDLIGIITAYDLL